jgi:peptide/nickel transport system substrate-binding protein
VAYEGWLDYALSGPVGKNATGNVERWNDPATQQYLSDYRTATTDDARLTAMHGLEKVMVDNVPIIPLVYSVDWAMYRSETVTGWPTDADPYAPAAPYTPGAEIVVLRLKAR